MACNVIHVYVYTKGYNDRNFDWHYEEQEHWKPNMSLAPNPHRRFSCCPTSDQFMNGRVDICCQYFFRHIPGNKSAESMRRNENVEED